MFDVDLGLDFYDYLMKLFKNDQQKFLEFITALKWLDNASDSFGNLGQMIHFLVSRHEGDIYVHEDKTISFTEEAN